jgi:hypothetical protein
MATANTILERSLRQMLSGTVEEKNKLSLGIDASATSLTTTYDLKGLRDGVVFEIDSEQLYVWSSNAATKTLVVERGFNGTTAAAHATDAVITSRPRFPKQQMLDALNAEIDDLSSPANGLFRVVTADLTYNGSDRQINLTGATNVIDLMEVRLRYQSDDYPIIRGVRLQRNLPTSDFASGIAIVFDESVMAGSLRVTYKAPFTRLSSLTDDITTVGNVPATCEDILELGVILRMMNGREIKRNFIESQGDTRRSDEVPAGATRDSLSNLQRLRRERIVAEAARLMRQYATVLRK